MIQPHSEELTEVTFMLDWVPNTNHTGIFVAQERGYFTEAGTGCSDIIEPGEVFAEQAVSGGAADFGISFQEQVTLNRADGGDLVSIAAVIQHNSSGFASRADLGCIVARRLGRADLWIIRQPLRGTHAACPDGMRGWRLQPT